MNVQLKVHEDAELRQWVKDIIESQVKSIIRASLLEIVVDVMNQRIAKTGDQFVQDEIHKLVQAQVNDLFKNNWNSGSVAKTILADLMREKLEEWIKNGMK